MTGGVVVVPMDPLNGNREPDKLSSPDDDVMCRPLSGKCASVSQGPISFAKMTEAWMAFLMDFTNTQERSLHHIFVVGNGHLTGVITRHDNFRFPIPQKDEGARHPYYQGSRTPHLVVTKFQFAVRTLGMRPLARQ